MCGMFKTIIPTILGGFIAGWVGIIVANWRTKKDAINAFLVSVSVIKGAIPAEEGISQFFESTKTEIRDAVFRVIPFVSEDKALQLQTAWIVYGTIKTEYLSDNYTNEAYRLAHAVDGLPVPENPVSILKNHLDRFASIVK